VLWLVAAALAVLAHTAPFPFLLDTTDRTTATPLLLDTLARHGVRATFFIIDKHLTPETAPIVRRAFDDGHAVALHSHTRALLFQTPGGFAQTLRAAAERMQQLTGRAPCRAFRPHAGNRSLSMLLGATRAGYRVIGWGWMLWDFNWFRAKTADSLVPRLADRASPGDIIVIHDGHHREARADRRYAVDTVDRLIPELETRGFRFGTICP
jgi:peptidoglycan-N-acetylglucosamine deacetylase